MEFDIRGNLKPYDVIETDLPTFKREFVDAFSQSRTRSIIFNNFSSYLEKLTSIIGLDFYVWVDGSYVTRKLNPEDIDFVSFVDAQIYYDNEPQIDVLRAHHLHKKTGVDDYFVRRFRQDHRNYLNYTLDVKQWNFAFSTSRSGGSKGFIQLNF